MDHQDIGVGPEATPQGPCVATNAVRDLYPRAEVFAFPADAIIRRRPPPLAYTDDQVVVIHNGETAVYDSPSALYAVFAAADPKANGRLKEAEAVFNQATATALQAQQVLAAAMDRKRQAERLLSLVWLGFVVAGVLGAGLLVISL